MTRNTHSDLFLFLFLFLILILLGICSSILMPRLTMRYVIHVVTPVPRLQKYLNLLIQQLPRHRSAIRQPGLHTSCPTRLTHHLSADHHLM